MSGRVFLAGDQEIVVTLGGASSDETKHALRALSSLVCTVAQPISLTVDGLSLLKPSVLTAVGRVIAKCVIGAFTLSSVSVSSVDSVTQLTAVLNEMLQQPDLRKVTLKTFAIDPYAASALGAFFVVVASLVEELCFEDMFVPSEVVKQCLAQSIKRLDLTSCSLTGAGLSEALRGATDSLESLGLQVNHKRKS
jgi:hypothetical protein